ncbi:hypothetical protein NPS74_10470, partial [Cutibacterium acnes subsp. acnes]|nr:hypothetical protein [Cutibacterium acnes subsp. acnes]
MPTLSIRRCSPVVALDHSYDAVRSPPLDATRRPQTTRGNHGWETPRSHSWWLPTGSKTNSPHVSCPW